jgi:hypothetical protein
LIEQTQTTYMLNEIIVGAIDIGHPDKTVSTHNRVEKEEVVQGFKPITFANSRFLSYEEGRELTEQLGNRASRRMADMRQEKWFEPGTATANMVQEAVWDMLLATVLLIPHQGLQWCTGGVFSPCTRRRAGGTSIQPEKSTESCESCISGNLSSYDV